MDKPKEDIEIAIVELEETNPRSGSDRRNVSVTVELVTYVYMYITNFPFKPKHLNMSFGTRR